MKLIFIAVVAALLLATKISTSPLSLPFGLAISLNAATPAPVNSLPTDISQFPSLDGRPLVPLQSPSTTPMARVEYFPLGFPPQSPASVYIRDEPEDIQCETSDMGCIAASDSLFNVQTDFHCDYYLWQHDDKVPHKDTDATDFFAADFAIAGYGAVHARCNRHMLRPVKQGTVVTLAGGGGLENSMLPITVHAEAATNAPTAPAAAIRNLLYKAVEDVLSAKVIGSNPDLEKRDGLRTALQPIWITHHPVRFDGSSATTANGKIATTTSESGAIYMKPTARPDGNGIEGRQWTPAWAIGKKYDGAEAEYCLQPDASGCQNRGPVPDRWGFPGEIGRGPDGWAMLMPEMPNLRSVAAKTKTSMLMNGESLVPTITGFAMPTSIPSGEPIASMAPNNLGSESRPSPYDSQSAPHSNPGLAALSEITVAITAVVPATTAVPGAIVREGNEILHERFVTAAINRHVLTQGSDAVASASAALFDTSTTSAGIHRPRALTQGSNAVASASAALFSAGTVSTRMNRHHALTQGSDAVASASAALFNTDTTSAGIHRPRALTQGPDAVASASAALFNAGTTSAGMNRHRALTQGSDAVASASTALFHSSTTSARMNRLALTQASDAVASASAVLFDGSTTSAGLNRHVLTQGSDAVASASAALFDTSTISTEMNGAPLLNGRDAVALDPEYPVTGDGSRHFHPWGSLVPLTKQEIEQATITATAVPNRAKEGKPITSDTWSYRTMSGSILVPLLPKTDSFGDTLRGKPGDTKSIQTEIGTPMDRVMSSDVETTTIVAIPRAPAVAPGLIDMTLDASHLLPTRGSTSVPNPTGHPILGKISPVSPSTTASLSAHTVTDGRVRAYPWPKGPPGMHLGHGPVIFPSITTRA